MSWSDGDWMQHPPSEPPHVLLEAHQGAPFALRYRRLWDRATAAGIAACALGVQVQVRALVDPDELDRLRELEATVLQLELHAGAAAAQVRRALDDLGRPHVDTAAAIANAVHHLRGALTHLED